MNNGELERRIKKLIKLADGQMKASDDRWNPQSGLVVAVNALNTLAVAAVVCLKEIALRLPDRSLDFTDNPAFDNQRDLFDP